MKKKYTDKNGKERQYTFFHIRHEFVETFMPELIKKKEKKQSFYDIIAALNED